MRYEPIRLADGTAAILRPLQVGDAPALLDLHERSSADSLYQRYLSPRTPTLPELEQVTTLNENGGGAIAVTRVTTQGEAVIGLAYYVALDEHTAEPAILIEDRYQRQGLGRQLMERLRQHALARGIHLFSATVYPQNRAILGLIRSMGMPFDMRSRYGAREINMYLRGRTVRNTGAGREAHPRPVPNALAAD